MPEKYGKWNSVWRCYDRWCKSGFWTYALDQIGEKEAHLKHILIVDGSHVKAHQDSTRSPLTTEDQKLGKTKGGWNTKISSCVNSLGLPVSSKIVCGQEFDGKSMFDVLPDNFKHSYILADKAYDTNHIRKTIAERGGIAVIPPKKNRVSKIDYDKEIGKLRRKVENFFGRIKRFRRVATRYDQKPENYFGFVTLASIKDWIV